MSTQQSNSKRLAKNTILMYFRMGFLMLISLYTSRVILQQLGVNDYGIYNLVGSVIMMFSALKEVFANSTNRFLAFELGQKNEDNLNLIYNLSIYVNGIISIIFVVLVEIIGLWFLEYKINVEPDRLFAAHVVFQLSLISTVVSIMTTPFNAEVMAHERMDFYAYLSIFEGCAKLGICFLLPLFPFDKLIFYGFLLLAITFIVQVCSFLFCRKHFAECRLRKCWNKEYFKKMTSFAGWSFFGNTSFTLAQNGINMIFNVFGGPAVNAARGISYQVTGAVNQFINSIAAVTTPFSVKTYAAKEYDKFFSIFYITSKLYFLIELTFAVIISFFAEEIIHLWLGQVPEYTVVFVDLVLLQTVFRSLCGPLSVLFFANGNIKYIQIAEGIILALPVFFSYILLDNGFPFYTAFISMIICEVIRIIATFYLAHKQVNLEIRGYIIKVLLPCICCLSLYALSYQYTLNSIDSSGLKILSAIITCLLIILLMFAIGTTKDEKKLISNIIRRNAQLR